MLRVRFGVNVGFNVVIVNCVFKWIVFDVNDVYGWVVCWVVWVRVYGFFWWKFWF